MFLDFRKPERLNGSTVEMTVLVKEQEMDVRLAKGLTPCVAGVVLLLSLLLNSCASTQQETDAALQYSPTLSQLESSPLSVPDGDSGFTRVYEVLGVEDFSTLQRGPALGFELGEVGTFPVQEDDRWIVGYSSGAQKYQQYYRTNPNFLRLSPNGSYEVRFDYHVLETGDEGFEVIFYSGAGDTDNEWVEQSLFITDPAGTQGIATMVYHLKDYQDYQLVMNVVGKGKIAVTDIQIKDLESGAVIAKEDTKTVYPIPSPFVRMEGRIHIGKSTFEDATYSAFTSDWAKIQTNPLLVDLPKDSIIIVEFDWKVLRNTQYREHFGYVHIYSFASPQYDRGLINLPGFELDGGHFVGGVKTGSEDIPYVLEVMFHDGAMLEIANLTVSLQKPEARSIETHPAQVASKVAFPRLAELQTAYFEWVAHDGSGTAQGDQPLTNLVELERLVAYSDVVAGMNPIFSTNDPAVSKRLRELNPDIVLLPLVKTHHVGMDDWMVNEIANPLATAEVAFIRGIDELWYLRDAKGNILNDDGGYRNILMNISPFCPYNSKGQTYIDYWTDTVMDLHVADGTWDGVITENLLSRTNHLIAGAYAGTKINADYNRNLKKDEPLTWAHEMTAAASLTMLRNLRERVGYDELIIDHSHFDYAMAPLLNGVVVPNFNLAWYLSNNPKKFSEGQWCWNVYNCWTIMDHYVDPTIVVWEATPVHPDWIPPENKREPEEKDIPFQRFAIGTALLTDVFFDYDLVDSRSAPYFFDEMLVDSTGRSTDSIEGKGWLGKALGEAEEIVVDKKEVANKSDVFLLGNKGSKTKLLYKGRNTEDTDRQYVMEFDWALLETASNVPVVNVTIDNEWNDYFDIPGVLEGSSGHVRFHTTVPSKDEVIFNLTIGKRGVLEIRNLKVSSIDGGVFRRDFEHGIVLVNATDVEKEVAFADIAGDLDRKDIRRIKGNLDVETNNGKSVRGPLVLPAHDAIVLLAD